CGRRHLEKTASEHQTYINIWHNSDNHHNAYNYHNSDNHHNSNNHHNDNYHHDAKTYHNHAHNDHSSACDSAGVCAVCSGLDCLLHDPDGHTCDSTKPFCYIKVVEGTGGSRDISRGCASRDECHPPEGACKNVEGSLLTQGTECMFCCTKENCNAPPDLLPAVDTR
ncbi:hypothetical protein BaRGS_00012354, partial [Batillaria attramentaria]